MAVSIYTKEFESKTRVGGPVTSPSKTENFLKQEQEMQPFKLHVNGMDHFKLFCEMTVWLVRGIKVTELVESDVSTYKPVFIFRSFLFLQTDSYKIYM